MYNNLMEKVKKLDENIFKLYVVNKRNYFIFMAKQTHYWKKYHFSLN